MKWKWWRIICLLLACWLLIYTALFHMHSSDDDLVPSFRNNKNKIFDLTNKSILPNLHDMYHDLWQPRVRELTSQSRVAIIVVYTGKALPSWFDSFAMTASLADDKFDWLLFLTEAPIRHTPANVKLLRLNKDDLYRRLSRLRAGDEVSTDPKVLSTIANLIENKPYTLVEFKPCLGFLFEDALRSYSHWAYADIDQLLGRMSLLISMDVLNNYDIYTSSFGDNFRLYMRGQLTIHKNVPYVTHLWKACEHLSRFDKRLDHYLATNFEEWNFESAEGCYSRVVADHRNLTIFVGGTQATDAFWTPEGDRETVLVAGQIIRCYEHELDLTDWRSLQSFSVGPVGDTEVPVARLDYRCTYWVAPPFHVCLDTIPSHVDTISRDTKFTYLPGDRYQVLGGHCRAAAVSHFQGWKGEFYLANTQQPPADAHLFVLTEFGLLPLRLSDPPAGLPTLGQSMGYSTARGRLIADPPYKPPSLMTEKPAVAAAAEEVALSYCAGFSKDTKKCVCHVSESHIAVLSDAAGSSWGQRSQAVTLITAAWFDEFKSGKLDNMLDSWTSGPKVVVLARLDADQTLDLTLSHRHDVTVVEVNLAPCASYSNIISPEAPILHDNLLFNIGLDIASTSLVCLSPAGIIFDFPVVKSSTTSAWQDSAIVNEMKTASRSLVRAGEKGDAVALVVSVFCPRSTLTERELLAEEEIDAIKQLQSFENFGEKSISEMIKDEKNEGIDVEGDQTGEEEEEEEEEDDQKGQEGIGEEEADNRDVLSEENLRRRPGGRRLEEKTTSPVQYPPKGSWCGSHQSNLLRRPFPTNHVISNSVLVGLRDEGLLKNSADGVKTSYRYSKNRVEFKAKEYLKERTLMLPVIFNISASPHGTRFVRMPEEMSGPGCFGSTVLRVLAGSGHQLVWSQYPAFEIEMTDGGGQGESGAAQSSCGCAHGGTDPNVLRHLATRLNSYYLRAVAMRASGVKGLYSRTPFGKNFEAEQVELIAKGAGNIRVVDCVKKKKGGGGGCCG